MKKKLFAAAAALLCLCSCVFHFRPSVRAASPGIRFAGAAEGEADAARYCTVEAAAPVEADAKAYLLMNAETGAVLAAKNERVRLYPASVTKIMTLLLTVEAVEAGTLKKEDVLVCSETAAAKGGSQIWLAPGEKMTVDDLLKAAFVYSANDACTLLAETVAGSESAFVGRMNEKAKALGMTDTLFDNCTGLDDDTTEHLTTAYDVALMSRALLSHDGVSDYTTIWMDTLRGGETQLVNTNRLIRTYPGAVGLKTGTTSKAGCCVSAAAKRDGMTLIAVVLGAPDSKTRFAAAVSLLDHGFANYELFVPPAPEPASLRTVPVRFGQIGEVGLTFTPGKPLLLDKGAGRNVTTRVEIDEETTAPVEAGASLGEISYWAGAKKLAACPLTAAYGVERLTVKSAAERLLRAASAA